MKAAPLTLLAPQSANALNGGEPSKETPNREAAQQFEQIFLRTMLSSLMRTSGVAGGGRMGGSEMYDSMIVDALATSISEGGGLGVATVIEQHLEQSAPARDPGTAEKTIQAMTGEAVRQ